MLVLNNLNLNQIKINHSGNSKLQQRNKNKTKIEKIDKLRYFGLNDEQIAEVLELPLEVIKQVDIEK
jgi:hypothetical protein